MIGVIAVPDHYFSTGVSIPVKQGSVTCGADASACRGGPLTPNEAKPQIGGAFPYDSVPLNNNSTGNTKTGDNDLKLSEAEMQLLTAPSPGGNILEQKDFYERNRDCLKQFLKDDPSILNGSTVRYLRHVKSTTSNDVMRSLCEQRITLLSRLADIEAHLVVLNKILDEATLVLESGVLEEENLTDLPGEGVDKQSGGETQYAREGQVSALDMGDYLSRPVRLLEQPLALNTDINIRLAVWDLFSLAPSVRAKMRNFAYLKGNLKLRIAVSGSPFHYGRLLVSYQPYGPYNINIAQHAAALTPTWRPMYLNYLSQAPGSTTIDVKENRPLELECPFLAPKPMHRLFNAATTTISGVTSFDDLKNAGDLFIYSLNQVSAVSASPTTVYLQIYAWIDNAEMGTNTATLMDITTESGPDEHKTGPIENVASRALEISSALENVPSIGFLAKASSIVLGATRSLAAHFGWSRPVLTTNPTIFKLEPFQNGAHTIGSETLQRITLDPKQELTIDPRITGSSEDEMSISHIAQRCSYYNTFTWSPGAVVMGTPLHIANVTPCIGSKAVVATTNYVQPTAMCFAAQPFVYWRGDVTYRFEVVASAFHRGKLAVVWEPNVSQISAISANIAFNKQYIRIIDIQETSTFEVTVKWGSYRSWLLVSPPNAISNNQGGLFTVPIGYVNGTIMVTPFTQLQSPDGSSVAVNCYAYADNIRFNQLSQGNMPTKRGTGLTFAMADVSEEDPIDIIEAESGYDEEFTSRGVGATSKVVSQPLNHSTATFDNISEYHFGEQPVSFRTLMKRYVTNAVTSVGTFGSAGAFFKQTLVQPIMLVNGMPYGTTGAVPIDLYTYLKYAYLGVRGGIRRRFHYTNPMGQGNLSQVRVTLRTPETSDVTSQNTTTNPCVSFLTGTVMFVPSTVGGVEFELPFYTNNLWLFAFNDSVVPSAAASSNEMESNYTRNFELSFEVFGAMSTASAVYDGAIGEDFSFLRYQGAPFFSY